MDHDDYCQHFRDDFLCHGAAVGLALRPHSLQCASVFVNISLVLPHCDGFVHPHHTHRDLEGLNQMLVTALITRSAVDAIQVLPKLGSEEGVGMHDLPIALPERN